MRGEKERERGCSEEKEEVGVKRRTRRRSGKVGHQERKSVLPFIQSSFRPSSDAEKKRTKEKVDVEEEDVAAMMMRLVMTMTMMMMLLRRNRKWNESEFANEASSCVCYELTGYTNKNEINTQTVFRILIFFFYLVFSTQAIQHF